MNIKAKITTVDYKQVNIDTDDVFSTLADEAWKKLIVKQTEETQKHMAYKPGQYINDKGFWETHHPMMHSNGYDEQHRAATYAELELKAALHCLKKVLGLGYSAKIYGKH